MSTRHACGGTYVSIARMSRFGRSEHTDNYQSLSYASSFQVYGLGCSDVIQELEEMLAYLEPYKNIPTM
jgi:hypothetical protein